MRLVGLKLENQKQSPSDATIAAVACLTVIEVISVRFLLARQLMMASISQNLSGNAANSRAHMDGLESLVKSRGGLQALGGTEHVRSLVSW